MANLIVLGKNLFDVEMYDVSETAVHLTMMNGRITHRDGSKIYLCGYGVMSSFARLRA